MPSRVHRAAIRRNRRDAVHPDRPAVRMRGMTAPEVPDTGATPQQARAMRRRLLERVAEADGSHTTVHADEGDWQPFIDGVSIKVLRDDGGVLSYLLRLAPGAALPPHRHPLDEECMVLDGTLRIGSHTEVRAGGYHLAHRGALHPTVSTRTGATIFLRGAAPEAEHALG